jgi:hypothetical protein
MVHGPLALSLRVLPARLAICRLDAHAPVPSWAGGSFVSITRTPAELSIVADEIGVPDDVIAARGYRAIEVIGPIPLDVVGVMATLSGALAGAGISLLPIATYDTDYVLVQERDLESAIAAVIKAGYAVESRRAREP